MLAEPPGETTQWTGRAMAKAPMRAEARARLLQALAKARLWLDGLIAGTFASTAEIALHERCSRGRSRPGRAMVRDVHGPDRAAIFVKVHSKLRMSPAMAAGVADRLWDIRDIMRLVEAADMLCCRRVRQDRDRAVELVAHAKLHA